MQNVYFEDYEDLACDIADKFDMVKDDFGDVAIIAKYEEAKEIIAELVCIGYPLVSLDIRQPEWENYRDEFIISLNVDGIWCEPMKRNGEYLTDTSDIIYILDNCSSRTISYCRGDIVFEVGIVNDEECDCDCDECQCACTDKEIAIEKDGNMHGFSVNQSGENGWSSYSFYSTDMDLVKTMAKLFE